MTSPHTWHYHSQGRAIRTWPECSVTQIRNATLHINYAGVRFLADPMLAPRGSLPGLPGTPNGQERNPLVELPMATEDIVDVDAVIVTHLHPDHWDEVASAAIEKSVPLFVQNESDAAKISAEGFTDARVLGEDTLFRGITLTRTPGAHARPETMKLAGDILGEVCGVVLRHEGEPTLYMAGDTVWTSQIRDTLEQFEPDVVILNAGYAQMSGLGPILMGAAEVGEVARTAPFATIVASHMEAFNHCILSREELRDFAEWEGFSNQLRIPLDGETVYL